MAQNPEFSEDAAQAALSSVREYYSADLQALSEGGVMDDGNQSTLAQCISITLKDGKACIKLPLGFGDVCIPFPIKYDGDVAKVCLSICTTVIIPTGVKVTISVGGITIVTKTFGRC